ncbi:MAG: D-alanine--D-alanine ligase family protein [Planctomycetota bacterium]
MTAMLRAGQSAPDGLPHTPRTLDVTVLMGGPSSEREVSLLSGEAIAGALENVGHKVSREDISPNWTSPLDREGLEVVFIALHGQFGESGDVQQLCEARGLPYTGSPPHPSEQAMNKVAAKQVFKHAGLNVPDWMVIEEFHKPVAYRRWLDEFGMPVAVKPVNGGSSIDITLARDEATRDEAIEELLDKYSRVMVEKLIDGRELTVGIVGPHALPLIEVVPGRDFYDYSAKYDDDADTRYVFEHGLDDELVGRVQSDALSAHDLLGCRDLSRVDFLLDAEGVPYLLEVNTIRGFTSHSLVPKAAAAAGIDFEHLVDHLLAMAWNRRKDKQS